MTTLVANTIGWPGLSSWWENYRENSRKHRAYRETVRELERLSDAELRDIGLSRANIRSIALETHFDNRSVR